jgi:hypothetical protein
MKTLLLTATVSFFFVYRATSGMAKSTSFEVGFLTDRERTPSLLCPFVPFVVQNINTQKITVFGNPGSNTLQVRHATRQAKPSVSNTAGGASVRADRRYGPAVSTASVSNTTGGASIRADRRYGPAVSAAAVNLHFDTLPSVHMLHQSIDSFYAQQTHLELLAFKDSKKGEWLKFLPNLGITYALDGQPRPSLSLSSGILYQSKKNKQQNAAKRQQIIEQQLQAAEQAKNQLADLILQYQQLQNEYRTQQELFAIETDLFRIKQDEYERQELAPSDFLHAKRTYLLQQQAVEQKKHLLERLISRIKIHSHFQ